MNRIIARQGPSLLNKLRRRQVQVSYITSNASVESTAATTSIPRSQTRIVIVGSGAIGLTYGGRLLEAEVSKARPDLCVEFIARKDYLYLKEHGYTLKSPDGSVSFSPRDLAGKIHQTASTIENPQCIDWILCCVKSYAFRDEKLRTLLEALVGPSTRILLVMNGLQCEEVLKSWFGAHRVYVGMAFTCINRNTPPQGKQDGDFVLVNHIAFGSLLVGHSLDDDEELSKLPLLWKGTTIEAKVTATASLRHAQWSKLCWNVPFSGLSVALGGVTTQVIANDPHLRRLADRVMTETIDLANADLSNHHSIHPNSNLKLIDKEATMLNCWHLTDTMGPYVTSTVLDLVAGNMLETEYIFDEPLRQARRLTQLGLGGPYPGVEHVVELVHAISNIAEEKKRLGILWVPTHLPSSR